MNHFLSAFNDIAAKTESATSLKYILKKLTRKITYFYQQFLRLNVGE